MARIIIDIKNQFIMTYFDFQVVRLIIYFVCKRTRFVDCSFYLSSLILSVNSVDVEGTIFSRAHARLSNHEFSDTQNKHLTHLKCHYFIGYHSVVLIEIF